MYVMLFLKSPFSSLSLHESQNDPEYSTKSTMIQLVLYGLRWVLPLSVVIVVKAVSGDGEIGWDFYTSASDRKECVGEKWERIGLKKGLTIHGK